MRTKANTISTTPNNNIRLLASKRSSKVLPTITNGKDNGPITINDNISASPLTTKPIGAIAKLI